MTPEDPGAVKQRRRPNSGREDLRNRSHDDHVSAPPLLKFRGGICQSQLLLSVSLVTA